MDTDPVLWDMPNAFRVSASAIEAFRRCPYAWYLKYIQHQVEYGDPSHLKHGSQLHEIAEAWLNGNKAPKELQALEEYVAPGFAFLPKPLGTYAVEAEVSGEIEGVPMIGYIDFWYYDSAQDELFIGDWKSTKDFKYAKKPAELAELVQPNIYAWALMEMGLVPEPKTITYQHIYLHTLEPASRNTLAENISVAHVTEVMDGVREDVKRMTSLATKDKTTARYFADTTGCRAYGGCRMAEHCSLCPGDVLKRYKLTRKIDTEPVDMSVPSAWTKRPPVPGPSAATTAAMQGRAELPNPPASSFPVQTRETSSVPSPLAGFGRQIRVPPRRTPGPMEVVPPAATEPQPMRVYKEGELEKAAIDRQLAEPMVPWPGEKPPGNPSIEDLIDEVAVAPKKPTRLPPGHPVHNPTSKPTVEAESKSRAEVQSRTVDKAPPAPTPVEPEPAILEDASEYDLSWPAKPSEFRRGLVMAHAVPDGLRSYVLELPSEAPLVQTLYKIYPETPPEDIVRAIRQGYTFTNV